MNAEVTMTDETKVSLNLNTDLLRRIVRLEKTKRALVLASRQLHAARNERQQFINRQSREMHGMEDAILQYIWKRDILTTPDLLPMLVSVLRYGQRVFFHFPEETEPRRQWSRVEIHVDPRGGVSVSCENYRFEGKINELKGMLEKAREKALSARVKRDKPIYF